MKDDLQGTLPFGKIKQAKSYKRHSCSREERILRYQQFLKAIKLRQDQHIPINIKQMRDTFHVAQLTTAVLPDMSGMTMEDITIEFTRRWYKDTVIPYNRRTRMAAAPQVDDEDNTLEDIVIDFVQLVSSLYNGGKGKLDDMVFDFIDEVRDFYRYDEKRTIFKN